MAKLGTGSTYALAFRDAKGDYLGGGATISFEPKAPVGNEANWVQDDAGQGGYNLILRFY